jgi:hypothetical protein
VHAGGEGVVNRVARIFIDVLWFVFRTDDAVCVREFAARDERSRQKEEEEPHSATIESRSTATTEARLV